MLHNISLSRVSVFCDYKGWMWLFGHECVLCSSDPFLMLRQIVSNVWSRIQKLPNWDILNWEWLITTVIYIYIYMTFRTKQFASSARKVILDCLSKDLLWQIDMSILGSSVADGYHVDMICPWDYCMIKMLKDIYVF